MSEEKTWEDVSPPARVLIWCGVWFVIIVLIVLTALASKLLMWGLS